MHPDDNVAIVVNDGGLPEGATFADGLTLREGVPQGHKVALVDLAAGDPIVRYNVVIGYALVELRRGSWVNERTMRMPEPPGSTTCRSRRARAPPLPPLEGYTFEGFRNADGSVGTRNILAITTTVQCVSGVVEHAVKRIRPSCCRATRTSTTWSASSTRTAAAWRSTRPMPTSRSARCATSA